MLDGANYCAIEKLRDGRSYIIRAQRRDDDIIDALLRHLALIARDAGISDLHAHILPDNRRALRVLDKIGFPCTTARKRNMMHVALHLDSTVRPGGSQAA
jgi:hypothetical protein